MTLILFRLAAPAGEDRSRAEGASRADEGVQEGAIHGAHPEVARKGAAQFPG